jgi:hypothetical protein
MHVGQCERCKALELVDIDEEIAPAYRFGVCAPISRKPKGRDKEPTEERRTVLADSPLCQIDQKYSAFIHELANVAVVLRCRENAVERGIGEEGPNLVLNGRDAFSPIAEGELVELLLQKWCCPN